MAQSVKIILEDDLEGGPADETLRFGLDGKSYEIDLSEENARELREMLAPYVSKGRGVQGSARRQGQPSRIHSDTAKIRAWAKEKGLQVSDRGRIHQDIRNQYYEENKQ